MPAGKPFINRSSITFSNQNSTDSKLFSRISCRNRKTQNHGSLLVTRQTTFIKILFIKNLWADIEYVKGKPHILRWPLQHEEKRFRPIPNSINIVVGEWAVFNISWPHGRVRYLISISGFSAWMALDWGLISQVHWISSVPSFLICPAQPFWKQDCWNFSQILFRHVRTYFYPWL